MRSSHGWRLSPAFDMNPCPVDVKRRIHVLAIDALDGTASLATALAVAPQFGLSKEDAQSVIAEVGAAVSRWRDVAKAYKLKPAEIDRMSSAFEHDDLRQATSGTAKQALAAKPAKADKKRTKFPQTVE